MRKTRLCELRKEKNVTQGEIAKYLNVTRSAYSGYELGTRQMNYEILFLLADYFSVSADYLLGRYETNPILVTKDEGRLIERYRLLDERGKAAVRAALDFEYAQSAGESGLV
ncbi:MAG: helix-turn-helix domain-containing protein [Oscillospiraceae bacterium]|nr:helix-turn-helix domain-containing protein [Oscillospiraceae bacterium]